ncbi:YHYH protein [Aquimarina pacifica]|uniref:YHYH protein n=1 Tax=Aquimarina pacifica TaxID=1296415 RepID=UPI0019D3BDBC|nr:YHYH protein [Aquimarina pacifica]
MMKYLLIILFISGFMAITVFFLWDISDTGFKNDIAEVSSALHPAFSAFDTNNTDIYLEGTNVVIETNGEPNHETVWWGKGHKLYKEEPYVDMNRGGTLITDEDNSFTLTVSSHPQLAEEPTATNMGPIGISVSGANIFNDQEGNGALDGALSSIDWTGGHKGPTEYHYHLEPVAWSKDDEALIGILADGFFIYGRKCHATGEHPTDLDASGGHISTTQYTKTPEYHYHIINEEYINGNYIIFGGDYRGTPTIKRKERKNRPPRPSIAEIFSFMDDDGDNLLSVNEVKGPIKNDFSIIDKNTDGFISKEELEKAPKPAQGKRR